MITPTSEQNDGIRAVKYWYTNSNKPFFYLAGLAGSGKTTIAKLAVDACGLDPDDTDKVLYAAYTGKAAMVLRRKGMFASTIHELIYRLVELQGKLRKPVFELDPASVLRRAKILVLDECSMVSDSVARDVISYGVKILVLGDPGQLSPPKGVGYFTSRRPDFFLEEIHRQALESPIIRWSHEVRNHKEVPYGDHGGVRKMRIEDYDVDDFIAADQIVTGTHKLRHDLNEFMLEAEGFDVTYPFEPGVKVICMRNYRMDGLFNGMIGRTMDFVDRIEIDEENRNFLQRVHIEEGIADDYIESLPMRMNFGEFEDTWEARGDNVKTFDAQVTTPPNRREGDTHDMQHIWAFGYAITVHKSQGSQWNNLCVCDNNHLHWKREERSRWLYTAMTRAVDQCDLVML